MLEFGKKYDHYVQVNGFSEKVVNADLAVWPINITLAANNLMPLKNDIETQKIEFYIFSLPKVLKRKNWLRETQILVIIGPMYISQEF